MPPLPFDKFGQKLTIFQFLAQIVELCLQKVENSCAEIIEISPDLW